MWKSLRLRWWYLVLIAVMVVRLKLLSAQQDWEKLIFFGLVTAGIAMNVFVIILNRGMPVSARLEEISEEERERCRPMDETTQCAWLGDWIPVRDLLISPGDILLVVGAIGMLALTIIR